MSREDGFTVMDVSTDIVNDPKVRKLFRVYPEHAPGAFLAFIATLGESWKAGRRVKVEDAWPGYLTFEKSYVDALVSVGLVDRRGLLSLKAWEGWFGLAKSRRDTSREKWRRENERRRGDRAVTAESPPSDREDTEATVPLRSSPTVRSFPKGEQGVRPLARVASAPSGAGDADDLKAAFRRQGLPVDA